LVTRKERLAQQLSSRAQRGISASALADPSSRSVRHHLITRVNTTASQESPAMLIYALVVFAVAALGGLVLASSVLRGRLAPWTVSVLHALLGASGLMLLVVAVLQGQGAGRATAALGLLVLAALGGFYLASLHLRKQVAPKAIVFVHAGVAVVGFLALLSTLLSL
jgi:hypothetical protein